MARVVGDGGALNGTFTVQSRPGAGVTLHGTVPPPAT